MPSRKLALTPALVGLMLTSLLVRVGFVFFTEFGPDNIAVYELGLNYYQTGQLPALGQRIVHTGTYLAGGLQSLLAGIGLYLSNGLPWGALLFVAVFNFLAAVCILKIYCALFPRFSQTALAALILLAPWTIAFTPLWNPSFLPLFAAAFLWGLLRWLDSPKQIAGPFWVFFSLPMIFQLHLSVAALGLWLLFLLGIRILARPRWEGVLLGGLLGCLTLTPYLAYLATENANALGSNAGFHPERVLDFPRFFMRYLTFATGETTRFVGLGGGVARAVRITNEHWVLWPFFLVSVGFSISLIFGGLRFHFHPDRWRLFRKRSLSTRNKHDLIFLTLPFLTFGLFLFSVARPSAHTFWVLMPFSFYAILRAIELKDIKTFKLTTASAPLIVYVIAAAVFAIVGHALVPRTDFIGTRRLARAEYPNITRKVKESRYELGVRAYYRGLKHQAASD